MMAKEELKKVVIVTKNIVEKRVMILMQTMKEEKEDYEKEEREAKREKKKGAWRRR
jgi:hypothetical protein